MRALLNRLAKGVTLCVKIDLLASTHETIFGKDCILINHLLDALKEGAKAYSVENRSKQISYEQIMKKLMIASADDSRCIEFIEPKNCMYLN